MQHFPQCYGVFTGLLMPTVDKKDSIFLKAFVSYVLKESNLCTSIFLQNVAKRAGLKSASTSAKWQFVGTVDQGENGGFMLNTDFALFYDLKGFMKFKVLKLDKNSDMKNRLIEYKSPL